MNELKMATNQKTLDVAIALSPLMTYLKKMGIISVDGGYGPNTPPHIQLTVGKFREIWPEVTPDSKGMLNAEYNGMTFVAWAGDPNG